MDNNTGKNSVGLSDLLSIFEENITVADISASRYLGKISASIVKKRTELNMTQKEFAKNLEVTQGMVSKWEGGDYNFSVKALAEIAEKLDMELYINLKPSKYVNGEVSVDRNSNYLYTTSTPAKYIRTKSNVINFIDRKSYVNKSEYSPELIEM